MPRISEFYVIVVRMYYDEAATGGARTFTQTTPAAGGEACSSRWLILSTSPGSRGAGRRDDLMAQRRRHGARDAVRTRNGHAARGGA
jgi:hypothetical protein